MQFSLSSQPDDLLKFMINLFCTSNIEGRELCCRDLVQYTIKIVLSRVPTCLRLGIMLDTTKLYSLISKPGRRKAGTSAVILL